MGAIKRLGNFARIIVFGASQKSLAKSAPRMMTFNLGTESANLGTDSASDLADACPATTHAPRILTFDLDGSVSTSNDPSHADDR